LIRSIAALLATAFCASASSVTLNFEGFPDSTILTNQYPDVIFGNAIVLTAGISLNEFEFPPHSGTNVVSDNGGPMYLTFASPISSFSGYFTYAEALTIQAFNAADSKVASASSPFSSNMALSGVAGSSPNEFLAVSFAGGISSITITGDPNGGSFVMDDVTITSGVANTPTPEPASLLLFSVGALAAITTLRRKN
jgi:hypothetical protein